MSEDRREELLLANAYNAGWRAALDDLRTKVEAEGHARFCATEDATPSFPDIECTCLRGRVLALLAEEES